ncbi:MAG: universal stress protein [Candidatus Atribacteria bacterium]|nr:universal stress protein [Candidatus Atribacteria bacterium]
MLRNILLVYQNNSFFQKAFEMALNLAKKYQARLHFFALMNRDCLSIQSSAENTPIFQKLLDFQNVAIESGIDTVIFTSCGELAVSVSQYAQQEHCGLVVIGKRHLQQGRNTIYFDAVDYLIKYLDCSIIIVKDNATPYQFSSEVIA